MKNKVTIWIGPQVMSFAVEDENLTELLKRIRPPGSVKTAEEIKLGDRSIKTMRLMKASPILWLADQLIDIHDLLPGNKATVHLFVRPSAVNFLAVEAIPQIAVPANKITLPN